MRDTVIDDDDLDLLDLFSNDDTRNNNAPTRDQGGVWTTAPSTGRQPSGPVVTAPRQAVTLPLQSPSRGGGGGNNIPHTPISSQKPGTRSSPPPFSSQLANSKPKPQPSADFTEAYSSLRVRNRLLSAEDMHVRMKGRAVHRLSALRAIPMRKLESQDPSDAWAAVGVLVSKSPRRQAANGGSFSIWTLSDLSRKENDLSVFLFQEALGSHWTVCEGTLLAVLGAKVLPAKGNGDNRLAVSVDNPWQINKVGMAMDYALCKGKRKDGKPCTMPVDKSQGGYCEYHVVAAFNRSQRQGKQEIARRNNNGNNVKDNSGAKGLRSMLLQGQSTAGHMGTSSMAARRVFPTAGNKPTASLSGILGAGARRREDLGAAARFGAAANTGVRTPAGDVKPLRPTATRAAGRTTILSSASAAGTAGAIGRSSGQVPKHGGCGSRQQTGASVKSGEKAKEKSGEDLLGLPWTYGGGGESDRGVKRSLECSSANRKRGRESMGENGDDGEGGERGSGGSVGKEERGRKRALDVRPPVEAHPAGYMDGSVVVPAPSKVYLLMPQRCGVRADGSRSEEGLRDLEAAKVQVSQQRVKAKADEHGILLRPSDPNLAVARQQVRGSRTPSAILGGGVGGGKVSRLGTGQSSGKSSDPLARKVKTMSAVEKELLLRQVSKYAGLAEEERANEADKNMQRLEQREAMADKAEEVTKMAVTVFDCAQVQNTDDRPIWQTVELCKMRRPYFSKRCRDQGHQQKGVKATLRFFECTNCRKRRSCTERVPQKGCEGCGKHDSWKRCGARPGRGPAEGPRDKRFVTSLSEWTDQRDLSLAGVDFR